MIIDGKFVENITCPKCRFRHPANISCTQADELARPGKEERKRIALIEQQEEEERMYQLSNERLYYRLNDLEARIAVLEGRNT